VGIGELGFGMTQSKCTSAAGTYSHAIAYPELERVSSLTRMLDFAQTHRLIVHLHTQDFVDPERQIHWKALDSYRRVQFVAPHIAQFMDGNPDFQQEVESRLTPALQPLPRAQDPGVP